MYCSVIARCIHAHQPSTSRTITLRTAAALRMARAVREDLAELSAAGVGLLQDISSSELPPALLTIFYPNGEENSFDADHDVHYLRFISALAKVYHYNHGLFEEQGLIKKCIKIVLHNSSPDDGHIKIPSTCLFYLAGIFLRIAPPERAASYFSDLTNKHWWDLVKGAWHAVDEYDRLSDADDILAALVMGTSTYMSSNAPRGDLEVLRKLLGNALYQLGSRPLPDQNIVSAVRGLKDKVRRRLEATGQKE
ncbi:hypothetical protein M405DRAFT_161598 [Rhizopogon salebrosus TDB-379]|nr:hypothetical protein M405DRAFT_161598 [Rhizopogon salebrosus TDB-379]